MISERAGGSLPRPLVLPNYHGAAGSPLLDGECDHVPATREGGLDEREQGQDLVIAAHPRTKR